MKAKKSYGQHFLQNEHIAQQISEVPAYETGNILEVGPGKGALTKYLTDKADQLKVVEADRDMVRILLADADLSMKPEQIIEADFLKLDLSGVFNGKPFTLIGNYPYNISSQIIIKMIQQREFVPEMCGMFQKEVADRIISEEGSKVYGTLSVLTQVYYDVERSLKVSPGNFNPPPKVDSAVIYCKRKEEPLFEGPFSALQTIVRSIFGQRRKMLRNSLKPLFSKDQLEEIPYATLRPEQLKVEDFVELADLYWKTRI